MKLANVVDFVHGRLNKVASSSARAVQQSFGGFGFRKLKSTRTLNNFEVEMEIDQKPFLTDTTLLGCYYYNNVSVFGFSENDSFIWALLNLILAY